MKSSARLAVIDTETTGLGQNDRVVEVGAVILDAKTGEIVDEFDTLVNPMRDVGPVRIHGVTSSMLSAAPTFSEIAAALATRLDGSVLVAHNLAFDVRFLENEYERLGANFDSGEGICTLRLTRQRLNVACEQYGIEIGHHHRALADARAAAALLWQVSEGEPSGVPVAISGLRSAPNSRTLRRETVTGAAGPDVMARLVAKVRYPSSDGAMLSYLDLLDWVLDDMAIDRGERSQLKAYAVELGLSRVDIDQAHRAYFESLVVGAKRDGVVTNEEHAMLETAAVLLGVTDAALPPVTAVKATSGFMKAGMRVCFTGEAHADGKPIARGQLKAAAIAAGLEPVDDVTRRCDLLVCVDLNSGSRKASKARRYNIPIIDIETFAKFVGLR